MSAGDTSKELNSLLKTLRNTYAHAGSQLELTSTTHGAVSPQPALHVATIQGHGSSDATPVAASTGFDPAEPVLSQFVRSFLLWESTSTKALQAQRKLEASIVDFNELRACLPDEIVRCIGERYPRAGERSLRLRTSLNVIFAKEHAVSLEHLAALNKRDARDYLHNLDGTPGFVAARVVLLALGHHAAPVDSRILRRLQEAKVVPDSATTEEAATFLEKKSKPGELLETYALLQAWADDAQYAPAESHLNDLKPRHTPVSKHVKGQQEADRRAEQLRKRKLKEARSNGQGSTGGKAKPTKPAAKPAARKKPGKR